MKKAQILVVDDDPVVRRSCERILGEDYDLRVADSGSEGLSLLAAEPFDLALVDLKLPDVCGMDILRQAPDRFPDLPIIIITGYSTIKSAVEAVKMGAFDYVAKPFTPDEIEATVEKALRQRRFLKDYRKLQEVLSDRYKVSRLIGSSAAMKRVLSLVEQVAKTDSTVLLTGESALGRSWLPARFTFPARERMRALSRLIAGPSFLP